MSFPNLSITHLLTTHFSGKGSGPAVLRSLLKEMLCQILQDTTFFLQLGSYYGIIPSITQDDMAKGRGEAYGQIVAMYMIAFGEKPSTISPFLLLYLILPSTFIFDLQFVAALERETANRLAILSELDTQPEKGLIRPWNHGISQLLVSTFDANVSPIPLILLHGVLTHIQPATLEAGRLTEEGRNEVVRSIQMHELVGNRHLHSDARALAFQKGFNIKIRYPTVKIPFGKTFVVRSQEEALNIFGALYSRELRDPKEVVDMLAYKVHSIHNDEVSHLFESLLQHRFASYLCGTGHVDHPMVRDLEWMRAADIDKAKGDTTLRARLFIHAVCERHEVPLEDFKITVNVVHRMPKEGRCMSPAAPSALVSSYPLQL